MGRLCLITGIVMLGIPSVVRAEIMVGATLEWLADHCPDSAIYEVRVVEKKPDLIHSYKVSFLLKRTLRGKPPEKTTDSYYPGKHVGTNSSSVRVGDEFLICFQHDRTGEARSVQLVNLSRPALAFPGFIAVSCDLKLLKSKKDILKVFEHRLESHPKGDPIEFHDYSKDNRFELEWGTEVHGAIYSGSSCYLRVPKDLVDQVKQQSKRQANQVLQRSYNDARR
jgi:hypothetical protein